MLTPVELKTMSVDESALRFINKSVYMNKLNTLMGVKSQNGFKVMTDVSMNMLPDAPYFKDLKNYINIDNGLQAFHDIIDLEHIARCLTTINPASAIIRYNQKYSHAVYSQFFIKDNTLYMTHFVSDAEVFDGLQYEFVLASSIFFYIYGYMKSLMPNLDYGEITYNIGMLYSNNAIVKPII